MLDPRGVFSPLYLTSCHDLIHNDRYDIVQRQENQVLLYPFPCHVYSGCYDMRLLFHFLCHMTYKVVLALVLVTSYSYKPRTISQKIQIADMINIIFAVSGIASNISVILSIIFFTLHSLIHSLDFTIYVFLNLRYLRITKTN